MAFRFPFSNLHELNLDWILAKVKTLVDQMTDLLPRVDTLEDEVDTIDVDVSGKVDKAGDIMTGRLQVPNFVIKSTNLTDGVVVASDTAGNGQYNMFDNADYSLGYIMPRFYSDGKQGVRISSRRNVSGSALRNDLDIMMTPSGDAVIYVSSPQAWLKALGLGTDGVLPLPIAQGGTGATTAESAQSALGFNSNCNVNMVQGGTSTTSDTLNVPNSYRGLLIITDSAPERTGLFIVISTGAGVVSVVEIYKGTSISYSTSTNQLIITKPSSSLKYFQISLLSSKITI